LDNGSAGEIVNMSRRHRSIIVACVATAGACSSTPSVPSSRVIPTTAHAVTLSRGSLSSATLEIASGATSVDVLAAAGSNLLVSARTPTTSSQRPTLALSPDHVADLQLASSDGGGGPSVVTVLLNPSVVWTIDLDGGATAERVDMSHGQLAAIDLGAGASRAVLTLPTAHSTQVIRETGGVSDLTVVLPAAAATKVAVHGGAGTATIIGHTHSGVAGGETFTDPSYPDASDRVDLDLQGGVSSLVVRRR
jgi:hypothetical protein